MTITPWQVLQITRPRQNLRIDTCVIPGEKTIEKIILEYGNWVNILAITPAQEVLLIRQYRHGIGKTIWEIPGGAIDEGETPIQAAERELLEETGYRTEKLVETGAVSPNPDNHTNVNYTFLALDATKASAQDLDDTEEIEVHPTPLEEVIRMALGGEILPAMQVSSLFFALAYLKRLS